MLTTQLPSLAVLGFHHKVHKATGLVNQGPLSPFDMARCRNCRQKDMSRDMPHMVGLWGLKGPLHFMSIEVELRWL